VLDPATCTGPSYPLGLDPVALVILEDVNRASAFVASAGSDTVTRVDDLGATVIDLCPGGGCGLEPLALDLIAPGCRAEGLQMSKVGLGNTEVELTWALVGCPPGTDSGLWCKCMNDEPDCPCHCACEEDEPSCACSADLLGAGAAAGGAPGLQLTAYMWSEVPPTGWKKLGTVPPFVHDTEGFELSYVVLAIPPLPVP
jgi:hypothetical protein